MTDAERAGFIGHAIPRASWTFTSRLVRDIVYDATPPTCAARCMRARRPPSLHCRPMSRCSAITTISRTTPRRRSQACCAGPAITPPNSSTTSGPASSITARSSPVRQNVQRGDDERHRRRAVRPALGPPRRRAAHPWPDGARTRRRLRRGPASWSGAPKLVSMIDLVERLDRAQRGRRRWGDLVAAPRRPDARSRPAI